MPPAADAALKQQQSMQAGEAKLYNLEVRRQS